MYKLNGENILISFLQFYAFWSLASPCMSLTSRRDLVDNIVTNQNVLPCGNMTLFALNLVGMIQSNEIAGAAKQDLPLSSAHQC